MADPLSIAASIAGVISLADVVFIRTRKYLSSAKNADKEVKDLAQEVLLLSGALHSLSRLAQAVDADGLKDLHIDNLRMHHIAACHATLDEVAKKLKKIEDKTKRKFIWPFVSDRTKELLAEISRHKQNVDLALTADSMGTLLRVLSKTEEAQVNTETLLEEARRTREITTRIHQDSGRKEILGYFLPYNPQQNYEMSLSLRHPRTGLWLTRKPEFQTWLEHPDSALWLSGIPGAGKTVLAGTIIEEALKRSFEGVATAFFFCDYKNDITQTTKPVLSALASQLAVQKEEAYGYLDRYYQELHPRRGLERRPDVSGLQRILNDMVKSFDHVYLVVDGLDECGENTDGVINGILDIIKCSDNISSALLSRDEDNIRDKLEETFTELEIAAHTEDITEFVTSEIERRISNRSLRIDDLSLKSEILERLIEGAKGMFRWVACQLDFLGDCLSDKECWDALSQLPPGLDESYVRILQRVPKGKERIVQMILNFIAHASPSLSIPLLREAISGPETLGALDTLNSSSIVRENSIKKLCRSLIRKSNDGRFYEFAHFSVVEFLKGEKMSMPQLENFRVSESICQRLLAKQCLNFLLFRNFSVMPPGGPELLKYIRNRNEQYPFYPYAAVYWPIFAKNHWMDGGLLSSAEILFQPTKTGNFTSWALELMRSFIPDAGRFLDLWAAADVDLETPSSLHVLVLFSHLVDENFTTLHMAALLWLPMICSSLIDRGGNIDQRSSFGCPLQCAVLGLYLAYPDEGDGLTAVGHPHYYKHEKADFYGLNREDTMRLLLESGATHFGTCSGPFNGLTLITVAMRVAFSMRNFNALNVLLEAGWGLQEDDLTEFSRFKSDMTKMRYFKFGSYGDFHLQALILGLGPIIDRSAAHLFLCQTAWSLAIETGCEFVQNPFFVDTRITLSQDALNKKILTSVKYADIDKLAEALKDPRADVTSLTGDDNKTVFQYGLDWLGDAIPCHGLTAIKLLVSAGLQVDRLNHEGLLPIHELAKHRIRYYHDNCYEILRDIVIELIQRGTGCNVQSSAGQNVFHFGFRNLEFIKAVLETDTEENILSALKAQDVQGRTPITLALQMGQEKVALRLLDRIKCDTETIGDSTAVLALCVTMNAHETFNVLLDARVKSDDAGVRMRTLLHYVGPKTSKEFVRRLTGLFPNGLRFRIGDKLPLDAYLENCITSQKPAFDTDVSQMLAAFRTDGPIQREKKTVWERFVVVISDVQRLSTGDRFGQGSLEDTVAQATAWLLDFGFYHSYEAEAQVCGILPLLRSLRDALDNLWPIRSTAVCDILKFTCLWKSVHESVAIVRLLKAATVARDVQLVELLLDNGVSVHRRIDKMSALEVACLKPAVTSDARHIFTLVLDHADSSRLDDINPHQGQKRGLVHYLAGSGKEWQLEKLLKRGVDVNIRTDVHVKAQPALVQQISEGSLDSAMALLEMGANPSLSDSRGVDAALTAAFQGNMSLLLHLHMAQGEGLQVVWGRTCEAILPGVKGVDLYVSGANALHLAAKNGHCDIIRFYLDKGLLINLDVVSAESVTPLHVAALSGHVEVVKFLHSRGANLNLKTADGSLPLHLAVLNECTESVEFLVEHGSAMDNDVHGMTPMAYAEQLRNKSILDCLHLMPQRLDYQLNPEKPRRYLAHVRERAFFRGGIKQFQLLYGRDRPTGFDLSPQNGHSALMLAIENSDEKLIKWLLAHGAKTTGQASDEDGTMVSPLQAMTMRPTLNVMLPFLLEKYQGEGGSVTAEEPSLICIAIQSNNHGLKIILDHIARHETTISDTEGSHRVEHGDSPVNLHRLNGAAPLHWAACRANCAAIEMLLDHGADVDVLDDDQMTPLQRAVEAEPPVDSPAVRLLLSYGAALEHRNEYGETTVMLASIRGKTELVGLLADAGADLSAASFSSWTCLHYAAYYGRLELFVWLVNRGVQLHTKDSDGWSAILHSSFREVFSSFILNFGSAIEEIETTTYTDPGYLINLGPAWLKQHFKIYLRRLGSERLRALAKLQPIDGWSPLCMTASIGQTLALTNILKLSANVDFEGCPCGSALMAACSAGRLKSVQILVRHGAAISYRGAHGFRSAVYAARDHKAILAWLLVHRFTEQRKLSDPVESESTAHSAEDVKPWSGVVRRDLIITDRAQRQVHESARDYWFRLMAVKKDWRGKVVEQHELARTHRPSRLIPEESVRICPGDYGTLKEQS